MKNKILLIILITITSNLYSQQYEYKLDTIIYFANGKTDSNNLKQGYWKYYCIKKINQIKHLIATNKYDTLILSDTNCYEEGEYLNNKKIKQWIYHHGICNEFNGTFALKTTYENYNSNGSIKTEYFEYNMHWEYIIDKDSTEIKGKIFLDKEKYFSDIFIVGKRDNDGKLNCNFETEKGELIDSFELKFLELKCETVYLGVYNRKLNKK